MPKKTVRRHSSRPKVSRANQESGLIATGKSVRQPARPKAALDNRSHRTPEVELRADHIIASEASFQSPLGSSNVR